MIYNKIIQFCAVRNTGGAYRNGLNPSNRVNFLLDLLKSEGIEYELDVFQLSRYPNNNFYNIILKGNSNQMVVAHHDVCNVNIDNANDNSASVINAIALKKLMPNLHVVLLDGEEPPTMGAGSDHLGQQIIDGKFGDIKWVLNLELTGKGGKYFFIGNYPGPLNNHIKSLFDCPVVSTPFNDASILRRYNIDSTVINPVPTLPEGSTISKYSAVKFNDGKYLDLSILGNCHSSRDTLSSISIEDMKEFTEKVLVKILS